MVKEDALYSSFGSTFNSNNKSILSKNNVERESEKEMKETIKAESK